MKVTIPAYEQHEGLYAVTVEIADTCPTCGGPRGEPFEGFSYDGSRRLNVSQWVNPCGHVDYYSDVRQEATAEPAKHCPICGGLAGAGVGGTHVLGCGPNW